nr:hypothetical protein [Tanacetum cinerariifolium]
MHYGNADMIMEDNNYVMYDKGLQMSTYDSDSSQEQDYDLISIKDDIRANRINLRRVMYETIMSSHDFEETGHKLMELELQLSQELDLCIMIIECCSMEIIYRGYIRLTENNTTSTSRTYIKILFQELRDQLGVRALKAGLSDLRMQAEFELIFPRDNPRNTRFSIKFFTSIGLGDITDNLKDYLKTMSHLMMLQSETDRDFRCNKRRRGY